MSPSPRREVIPSKSLVSHFFNMTRLAFRVSRGSRGAPGKAGDADTTRVQDAGSAAAPRALVGLLVLLAVIALLLAYLPASGLPAPPPSAAPTSAPAPAAVAAAAAASLPLAPTAMAAAPAAAPAALAAPPVLVAPAATAATAAAAAAAAAPAAPDGDAPAIPFASFSACLDEMRVVRNAWVCPTTGADWKAYDAKPETQALIAAAGGETPTMRAFMGVYEGEGWGCGSGDGSSIEMAARTICNLASILPSLLNVTLLVDFPCGDQQWAPHLRARLPRHIKYLGVDAMPGVVQRNRELFATPGHTEFLLAELAGDNVFDKIKAGSALWQPGDRVAVLSRHVLEHNTYAVDAQYISALRASGAEYYIGTSTFGTDNVGGTANALAGNGAIDFHAPPWNWRRGLMTWHETYLDYDAGGTLLEIWEVETLPEPVGIL